MIQVITLITVSNVTKVSVILKIVYYPLESERETVSEQFQGSWRLGTAQALHAQYKCVSTVDIKTPYGRVPRFLSTRELTDALCSLYSGDRYFLITADSDWDRGPVGGALGLQHTHPLLLLSNAAFPSIPIRICACNPHCNDRPGPWGPF